MDRENIKSPNCREAPLKRRHSDAFENKEIENVQPNKQINLFADGGSSGSSSEFSLTPPIIDFETSLTDVFSILGRQNSTSSWASKGDITTIKQKQQVSWNKFNSISNSKTSNASQTPLPLLSWAESDEVWQAMYKKDEQSSKERNPDMFSFHPSLFPRMRAVLLDWLLEVCDVYKLHRETYYLAVDYLDRYLSKPREVAKRQLQLIGITCLFIAAKVEEICPPKIQIFSYVTDGTCSEEDILFQELVILNGLNWDVTPITVVGWLSLYLQLSSAMREASVKHKIKRIPPQDSFVLPQFSGLEFSQICRLLDLSSMDPGVAAFPYSVVAAAAMVHTFSKSHAMRISGLCWEILDPCVKWMSPFFSVIEDEIISPVFRVQNDVAHQNSGLKHICENLVVNESHTLQTHMTTLEMFDNAQMITQNPQLDIIYERTSTQDANTSSVLLTPPSSSRKSLGAMDVTY